MKSGSYEKEVLLYFKFKGSIWIRNVHIIIHIINNYLFHYDQILELRLFECEAGSCSAESTPVADELENILKFYDKSKTVSFKRFLIVPCFKIFCTNQIYIYNC